MSAVHNVTVMTWEEFKKLFNGKYFPDSVRVSKRTEFASLKQGKMTVTEYVQRFEELSRFAPAHGGDERAQS